MHRHHKPLKHPHRTRGPASGALGPARGLRVASGSKHGFSLLELLMVVGLIAIIAGISIPVYLGFREQALETAAQADLLACAQGMERLYGIAFSYAPHVDTDGDGAGDADLGTVTANICLPASNAWRVRVAAANAERFTLAASPLSPGTASGAMELDSDGTRRWDRNGDDDFDDAHENDWSVQ